jgi:hypothetical protein
MDLVAFWTARLDEDEQRASKAAERAPWKAVLTDDWESTWVEDSQGFTRATHLDASDAVHIARHDPARALREVEAKRRLLGRYCAAVYSATKAALYGQIHDEAAVYSDHPDYDEKWAKDRRGV